MNFLNDKKKKIVKVDDNIKWWNNFYYNQKIYKCET